MPLVQIVPPTAESIETSTNEKEMATENEPSTQMEQVEIKTVDKFISDENIINPAESLSQNAADETHNDENLVLNAENVTIPDLVVQVDAAPNDVQVHAENNSNSDNAVPIEHQIHTIASGDTHSQMPINVFENSEDCDEIHEPLHIDDNDESLDYESASGSLVQSNNVSGRPSETFEISQASDHTMHTLNIISIQYNPLNVGVILDDDIADPEISTTCEIPDTAADDNQNLNSIDNDEKTATAVPDNTLSVVDEIDDDPSLNLNKGILVDSTNVETTFNTADDNMSPSTSSYQTISESNFTIKSADQCQIIDTIVSAEQSLEIDLNESPPDDVKDKANDVEIVPEQHDEKQPSSSISQNVVVGEQVSTQHSDIDVKPTENFNNEIIASDKNVKNQKKNSIRQTRTRSQSINIESSDTNFVTTAAAAASKSITRRGNSEPPTDNLNKSSSTMGKIVRDKRRITGSQELIDLPQRSTTPRRRTTISVSDKKSPSSPRSSRAKSVLSDVVDSPARHTRSAKQPNVEPEEDTDTRSAKINVEPEKDTELVPKKRTRKSSVNDNTENDDTESVVSGRSLRSTRSRASSIVSETAGSSVSLKIKRQRKKKIDLLPINEEIQDEDYTDSRRYFVFFSHKTFSKFYI